MNTQICIIGNPNSGKTTLFNALTGTYQKTGNFAGVTVEKKEGVYRKDKSIKLVDLPGMYSLKSFSGDERAASDYLFSEFPQAVINVVDGTNLARNLYLTNELKKLKIPVVIAVNFCDDLEKNGIALHADKLSELFGFPVVKISAKKGINLDKLIDKTKNAAYNPKQHFVSEEPAKIYNFIDKHISEIIEKKQTYAERFTARADGILTHKIFGIPIFIAVISAVYFLSLKLGGAVSDKLSTYFDELAGLSETRLVYGGIPQWLVSLFSGAVIKGLGTVFSFLPQILVLFLLLAVIEESGYAARAAFILDRFFRFFGLGGKSLIPFTLSCGCTVTGILSTRTIESESEKRMTVFLTPFMPCGAKTAVFGWFSYVFFNGSALVAASMYFLSIFCAAVFGKLLMKFKAFRSRDGGFLLEMPTLRAPSAKTLFFVMYEKVKDFTLKAGSVIFLVSILLWFLQNFGIGGYTDGDIKLSFIYLIGNAIKYIFYPLGFYGWETSVAIVSGIFAKEAVIEALKLISADCRTLFDGAYSVYAFMAFVLLSPPCASALATAKRELKSGKWFACMIVFEFLTAYVVSFVINLTGKAINCLGNLILFFLIVIIIALFATGAWYKLKNGGCKNCAECKRNVCEKKKKEA